MTDTVQNQIKYTFSGHESFHCRQLWLKKGYELKKSGKSFAEEDVVVTLGVGKNMVTAIKFWLKAFNIIDSDEQITAFGDFIFADSGFDPYLEDDQSLWLLHYNLIKTQFSSIYSLIFNEFRKEKMQFTKENFQSYVLRMLENVNTKTVADDFDVFKKMYLNKSEDQKLTEDSFLGLMSDLQLLRLLDRGTYLIENSERPSLTPDVFLYTVLDNYPNSISLSLYSLENDENSPGVIFALSRQGLLDIIDKTVEKYSWVVYSDHAGIKELQFKERPNNLFHLFNANI